MEIAWRRICAHLTSQACAATGHTTRHEHPPWMPASVVNDYGVTEHLSQHGVYVLDGARGQVRAVPAAACGQLAVELRETDRTYGLEPQLAYLRPNMAVDQVPIVLEGLGLDLYCVGFEPLVEVRGHGDRVAGAAESRQSRAGERGDAPTPGTAACRALRAEAHRARRCLRSAAPHPQAAGTRSNAPPVTAPHATDRVSVAMRKSRAALPAPGILSPREDHRQERSLRSRPSDGATRHS
jgi:hypothetical protein